MDEQIKKTSVASQEEDAQVLLQKLHDLFSSAPPQQLRESIHEIYLTYIIQNHEMLPVNFTRIATDIYYLIDFLDKAEK
ncbi:MAG: hypothetical protein ACTHJT_16720 [Cytophaga sp.]|uniref:hypothetical protein n=1 Tax=Cytophaga sp. TaxID=29535 RepID=UPI003F7D47F3